MRTYAEQLQGVVRQYRDAGGSWPAAARQVAAWAISQGAWRPNPHELEKQLAEQISRAMHDEYYTDPQGRRVRTKHAARLRNDLGEQTSLWGDIRTDSRQHLEMAFQQRRHQMVGEAYQLKTDVDSFNDNRRSDTPIQLSLDLTDDVAELELMDRPDVA